LIDGHNLLVKRFRYKGRHSGREKVALAPALKQYEVSPEMTPIPAKVTTIEKRGDQHHVIVQISTKYRGSFNTLAFGEIKPYKRLS